MYAQIIMSISSVLKSAYQWYPTLGIDMICCKALTNIGFVTRLTKEFSLNNTTKSLYRVPVDIFYSTAH